MTSTMNLEFTQAMADFKTMFPEMDKDVIEAVLRANFGAVDATIDQLLSMSTDNQNEKLRNELSPQQSLINLNDDDDANAGDVKANAMAVLIDTTDGNASTNNCTATVNSTNTCNTGSIKAAAAANAAILNLSGASASPLHHANNTGASPKQRCTTTTTVMREKTTSSTTASPMATATTTSTPTRRGTTTTATAATSARWNPPMLGPLPPGFLRIAPTATAMQTDGTRDFELPDEQFAMMLQNEEFMNQLRWNQEFMNALEKEQCGKAKGEDDAAFKERLRHMGKVSRKKFLQMARVFTWQRNKKVTTAKQIDSLPLKEEPSDDEDHHHHHQQQHQQQHQHQQQQQQHQLQHQHSQSQGRK